MDLVVVENLSKSFYLGYSVVQALKNVTMSVKPGEFLAIAGPSGSGKSTLLNILGCIESPDAGRVLLDGQEVTLLAARARTSTRLEKIGFIFQTFNLLPVLTVEENVEYPLYLKNWPSTKRKNRVRELLRDTGLSSHAHHKPAELSGGQRQRVAIARALAGSPALILADEPTANLDHKTGAEVIDLMKDMNRKTGTTFIFSTHDTKIIGQADRALELTDGEIAGL